MKPFATVYTNREAAIAETQELLARYRAASSEVDGLAVALEQLKRDEGFRRAYFNVPRVPLAVAELQGHAKRIVDEVGGRLISTQEVRSQNDEPHPRAAIRVQLEVGPPELVTVMHALESGAPFLFLDNLSIQPLAVRERRSDEQTAAAEIQRLAVQFDIHAYVWRPSP